MFDGRRAASFLDGRAAMSILNPAKARLLLIRDAPQIPGEEGWPNI